MSIYHDDRAIAGTTESPDLLNRTTYAKNLADTIVINSDEECLTVSLEGEWGTGKTSLVNLIKSELVHNNKKPIIIEYNPWLAGKAETLVQDFLVQFSSQLIIPDRPKEGLKIAKEILAYSKLFNVMKLIPGAEPWASIIGKVFSSVGRATNKISKLKELNLLDRKEKIKTALKKLDYSIVVIIDDIDRLTPDESFEVLRLVKAIADFPGTSFLMCFDEIFLSSSLSKFGIENSNEYIEKVVQLRIPIPLIAPVDLEFMFNTEFKKLSEESLTDRFDQDTERLSWVYQKTIKQLVRTPREIKRIFNNLRFVLVHVKDEVCFTDLFCLSVISIKAPEVYKQIKNKPEMFVGTSYDEVYLGDSRKDVVDKNKDGLNELLSRHSEIDEYLKGIISALFPLTADEFQLYSTDVDGDRSGRISSYKRLHIAMQLNIPKGYVSDLEVEKFVLGRIPRREFLLKVIQEESIQRFFEVLNQKNIEVDDKEIIKALKSIYDIFIYSEDLQEEEKNPYGMFGTSVFGRIVSSSETLINKVDDKKSAINELIDDPDYLPVTADLVRCLLIEHGEISSDYICGNGNWIDDKADVEDLKNNWINKVQEALNDENNRLLNSMLSSHVYYLFYRVAKRETKEIFKSWLSEENGIIKIAELIKNSGTDSVGGPYAHIHEESFTLLLDFKKLQEDAREKLESRIEIPSHLKAVYQSILDGKRYYLDGFVRADV